MLALGYLGFDERPDHSRSALDNLYKALQLFWLQSGDVHPVPLALQVARFGAPAIAGYAAGKAIAIVLRDQFLLLHARFLIGRHVLIAGLGATGFRLATTLHESGIRVVAIDSNPSNAFTAGCRERGIPVVTGDAADPTVLRNARIGRAKELVVACGEDSVNLDVLVSSGTLRQENRGLSVYVHLDDTRLSRALRTGALGSPTLAAERIDFFSLADLAGRMIVDAYAPTDEHMILDAGDWRQVIIIGDDAVAESLVLHTARRWGVASPRSICITVVGTTAVSLVDNLVRVHPILATICELRAVQVTERELEPRLANIFKEVGTRLAAAYVSIPRESDALALALTVHAHRMTRAPVVVVVQDEDGGVGSLLNGYARVFPDLFVYGILNRTVTTDLAEHRSDETIARAMHEEYVHRQRKLGITAASNAALVGWDELPDSLKDSNRRFAAGIADKLRQAGCVVVSDPLAAAESVVFSFSAEEIEELAIKEHERWVEDALHDGWRITSDGKDSERRLHPSLVGWDELSDDEQEKDRHAVRKIPGFLAQAGFSVHRVASASDPRLVEVA
jgi:voltage-gated potassium channel Kch